MNEAAVPGHSERVQRREKREDADKSSWVGRIHTMPMLSEQSRSQRRHLRGAEKICSEASHGGKVAAFKEM